jgi:hypothetical protein
MEKPWFKLDPNNHNDRWWLYSSIFNTETDKMEKKYDNVLCQLILQDTNDMGNIYWRFSTWYKDDPNRYSNMIYVHQWPFDISITDMKEGDIVTRNDIKFKIYNCRFSYPNQIHLCKILERIEE